MLWYIRIGTRTPAFGPKKRAKGDVRYTAASLSIRGILVEKEVPSQKDKWEAVAEDMLPDS